MELPKALIAASTTPLVLAILRRGPTYGYAIIQEVRSLSADAIQWSEGMLYPVLHRLEEDGLIEGFDREGPTGRARRYYRLRAPGARELERLKGHWEAVDAALRSAWGGKQRA